MKRCALALLLWLAALAGAAQAHEVRPAYLEIQERAPGHYSLLWRTPVLSGMPLPILLKLPEGVREVGEPVVATRPGARVERRVVETAAGGLAGQRIEFPGLEASITDVLVRVELLDGTRTVTLVRASQPWLEIAAPQGRLAIAGAFVKQGIEHILGGYDHLLFVFALMLIVRGTGRLLWTITAFTIAHSITLALATLGVVRVPGPPVEATIALSILLLAVEIAHVRRGQPSLTARWPWLVAFSFGLLHGFGFAGALSAIGLPEGEVPLALFAFNLGVEIGQLMFIAAVLALLALARRAPLPRAWVQHALPVANYLIGTLAAFWFIERIAAFAAA